jgi:hypothetical protein
VAGDWETQTIGQQVGKPTAHYTAIVWHPSGEPGAQVCGRCGVTYSRLSVAGDGTHYTATHSYKNGPEYTCRWPWSPAWKAVQA